jgi:hypothetical protein
MAQFEAGLDGGTFASKNSRLLAGLYRAAGTTARPTAVCLQLIRYSDADHGFSSCRPWLVRTVTDWLVSRLGN